MPARQRAPSLALSCSLLLALAGTVRGAGESPFRDAVAVWHMADGRDAAGSPSDLTTAGAVRSGVALEGPEREASLRRGGDGLVAELQGGYLSAGQGAGGELNLTGGAMSLCLRFQVPADTLDTPLFSKHGGHAALVYNLFWTGAPGSVVLGFELGTDFKDRPLRVEVPVSRIDPGRWHDAIARFSGAKLEFFVDGILVDEEWPIGSLRQGNREPCLIGAESVNGAVKARFRGRVDHAALWSRAIADDEIAVLSGGKAEIARRDEEILGKRSARLAYWKPRGHNASLGDCMPFFHDGRFHLYYLFDRRHHGSKWGLGAHQWAHVSTTDLVRWEEHPLAIPITEPWEGSICTGSVFFHEGKYYGHYAVRMPDGRQHLAVAVSRDAIRFEKAQPHPLASPRPGYDPMHYRDPAVFKDPATGLFHMLVTARLTDGRDGCIAHLISEDLKAWKLSEPFLVPGRVTDCPDWFEWNGWYYLLAEHVYWISRQPLGPWAQPKPNRLDVLYVPKTAAFTGNRRLYVSWLPDGGWGGNAVFRELLQHSDGTLGTRFVPEMVPPVGPPVPLSFEALGVGASRSGEEVRIQARGGFAAALLGGAGQDLRLSLEVVPEGDPAHFGLCLRGGGRYEKGCELRFDPHRRRVQLGSPRDGGMGQDSTHAIDDVVGLGRPFTLEVILLGTIVDVCVDHRRTLIGRTGERGDGIFLFAKEASVAFQGIQVRPLAKPSE
ncbi:MAG: hypothetical protein HY721_19455 [Planctomycetes bacterium]|nr:hypothetical protein [Planctomycetota bacterium]